MDARCPTCRKKTHNHEERKYLKKQYLPASCTAFSAKIYRFKCKGRKGCGVTFYIMAWCHDNDPEKPQKLPLLDDAYWNQAQKEKPGLPEGETSYSEYTKNIAWRSPMEVLRRYFSHNSGLHSFLPPH